MTCPRCGLDHRFGGRLLCAMFRPDTSIDRALAEAEAKIDALTEQFLRDIRAAPASDPGRFPPAWEAEYRRWLEGE